MHQVLFIESRTPGVLVINGQFCGPLTQEGQAFPTGRSAEVYGQLFPFSPDVQPLTVAMRLTGGAVTQLEPADMAYALQWPDGITQLELRPRGAAEAGEDGEASAGSAAAGVLLRYLAMRLSGDAQAETLLLRGADTPELAGYDAVVPLRFAPLAASDRFDERAGLVRRIAPNVARIDAALAATVPAGQGRRLIERIEIWRGEA